MATTYHEVVIDGPRNTGFGFLLGFFVARGARGSILNAEDEGFDCEPFREKIRELIDRSSETHHLLLPADRMELVREAVTAAQDEGLALAILTDRPVQGARFTFKFSIFSREHGERIRDFFAELPDGVTLITDEGFREEVHGDDTVSEVSAYAPAHQYALSAEGAIEGDVPGVLKMYRLCRAEELIQTHALELQE